jgi:hypothetical protein
MANQKILVKNMTNATVTLIIENANFKRTFKGEGAKTYIPFDILYEGLSDSGIEKMFTKGYLKVVEKQDRIDLGLEFEDKVESLENTMDSNEMLEIIKEGNAIKIKETLEALAPIQQKKFAQVAVDNEIYTAGLAKFIKDYTGIDLLKSIQDRKIDLEDN